MGTLLRRIQLGIGAGAALVASSAGCASAGETGVGDTGVGDTGVGDTGVSDTSVGDTGIVDASVGDGGGLRPYPLSLLGCGDAGPALSCCYSARCFAGPDNCVAPELRPEFQPRLEGDSCTVTGPFAANPDDVNVSFRADACCYVVGSMAIDGRPVFVGEALLLAPVIVRSDWVLG